MTQDKLEGHARALCESRGLNWDAQADPMQSAHGDDDEQPSFIAEARTVLLHELSLEPSRTCIHAALDAMYGGNLWRGHLNAMQLCEDMSAALRAYQAQRKREIKG